MLYPTHIKIENNVIKTINLVSTQDECVRVIVIADDDYGIFDVNCLRDFILAGRTQLKSLINYLF